MAVEALIAAIEAEGAARLAEIEQANQAACAAIRAEAQAEAAQREERAHEAALQLSAAERARALHAAELQAMQILGAAQASRQDQLEAEVIRRLARVRDRPEYRRSLQALIAEALAQLDPQPAPAETAARPVLEIDPRDSVLVEEILAASALEVTVDACLDCLGGIRVRTADGRITVVNTVEARLTRLEPYLMTLYPEWSGDERL